jgi:hypothetical protein
MLPRLLLELVLRLADVAERSPRMRCCARNITAAEVLGRPAAVTGRTVELRRGHLVEPGRLFEPRPDLFRDLVHEAGAYKPHV